MPQMSNLSSVDKLNVIFFGEMDISAAEKRFRVVMAAAFERILLNYYNRLLLVLSSVSEADRSLILAAAAAEFIKEYLQWFNTYYPEYLQLAGSLTSGESEQWSDNRAEELSSWISESMEKDTSNLLQRFISTIHTEINTVCALALMAGALKKGYTRKRWKTFGDEKVRKTHNEVNGETIPIQQPFIVGGYRMMFPGDTSFGAPAQEVVNCRCVVQYL